MSTSITEDNLEKKLQGATNSQDSIQTLSLWLLHHRAHHKKIVTTWLKVLKKGKVNQRLTLFYVANDVIQNSKRKGIPFFRDSFAEVLRDVTLLVRDEQIRPSVSRIFNIWNERKIYDSEFISELQDILENAQVSPSTPSKLLAEFKYETVIEKLRNVTKIELDTTSKMTTINISKLNATNAEIVQKLKDRSHGQQFSSEFDESTRSLEDLIKSLIKEIEERNQLILLLEQSQVYYDTQRGEAKIVANAYKNFGLRVKALQKKLEELVKTFPEPSPIPSPCPDAPSPTTSDLEAELELPSEDVIEENLEDESNSVSKLSVPLANAVGEPIPILSSFFNQDRRKMATWLDAFSTSTHNSKETKESGSLDSRLSNLMQNIPMLPTGRQDSVLGAAHQNSSSSKTKGKNVSSASSMGKDECSGQNTPLQDEDQSGTPSFFNRLGSTPKSSHNPKDILKGLTNLIQTVSSKENQFKAVSETPPDQGLIEKKTSKFYGQRSSASSPVFHTQENMKIDTKAFTGSPATSVEATHSPFFSQQSPASETGIHKNLSFIPTLVPSTPTSSNYKFEDQTYDPSTQSYDMDLVMTSEESNDSNSGKLPPNEETQQPTPRQSTLITLVTDNSSLEDKSAHDSPYNQTHSQRYPDKHWTHTSIPQDEPEQDILGPVNETQDSSFISSHSSDSNGRKESHPENWSQSKIETVRSIRSTVDHGQWSGNDWIEDSSVNYPFHDHSLRNTAQGYPDHKRYNQPQHFHSQTPMGWHQQKYSDRSYPRKQFTPFAPRGRGWNRRSHPY